MAETRVAQAAVATPHQDLHSERGALRDEHPGRSWNPLRSTADAVLLRPDVVMDA